GIFMIFISIVPFLFLQAYLYQLSYLLIDLSICVYIYMFVVYLFVCLFVWLLRSCIVYYYCIFLSLWAERVAYSGVVRSHCLHVEDWSANQITGLFMRL